MTYDKKWYLAFLDLLDYKNTYGDYKIPKDYYGKNSDINLYEWYQKQRQYYRNKKLSQDRIQKLDDFDITWRKEIYNVCSKREKTNIEVDNSPQPIYYWDRGYKFAKEYYETHNDLPHQSYIHIDEKTGKSYYLGRWVMNQMMRYYGEKKPLPQEQQKKFSIFM